MLEIPAAKSTALETKNSVDHNAEIWNLTVGILVSAGTVILASAVAF